MFDKIFVTKSFKSCSILFQCDNYMFKGALLGLRQFLTIENPLNVMEVQGSTNCAHANERARNVHANRFLRARKSIRTPLSSTPMLFKVLNYFCVSKQIIFGTIKSDIHNLFQVRSCYYIVIFNVMERF